VEFSQKVKTKNSAKKLGDDSMFDLEQHLARQMVFSRATFGPGARTNGVLDHISKEMVEVRDSVGTAKHTDEWVDMVILSLDGLTRAIWAASGYQITANEAAEDAVSAILRKQQKNERRDWPDWRNALPDTAIEHVRGTHD
jgi:hypothetical protein